MSRPRTGTCWDCGQTVTMGNDGRPRRHVCLTEEADEGQEISLDFARIDEDRQSRDDLIEQNNQIGSFFGSLWDTD